MKSAELQQQKNELIFDIEFLIFPGPVNQNAFNYCYEFVFCNLFDFLYPDERIRTNEKNFFVVQ